MISAEEFYHLIKLENYHCAGLPGFLAYRVRAAVALAYCAGLWFPEVLALRKAQWCPNGSPRVTVDSLRIEVGRRAKQGMPRTIPVSPAAQYVVGQYLAALPALPAPEDRFFHLPDRPRLDAEIRKAIARSGIQTSAKPSDLQASFEICIKDHNPGSDLAFYMVGAIPAADISYRFGNRQPPMGDMVQVLKKSHPVYDDADERLRATRRQTAC